MLPGPPGRPVGARAGYHLSMLPLLLALLIGAPAPGQAFGQPVEVEVRDLPEAAAREAAGQALLEIAEVERLASGGLAALNAAAGQAPQPVDRRLLDILTRARSFCVWSDGSHGPWPATSTPPGGCGRLPRGPRRRRPSAWRRPRRSPPATG